MVMPVIHIYVSKIDRINKSPLKRNSHVLRREIPVNLFVQSAWPRNLAERGNASNLSGGMKYMEGHKNSYTYIQT